MGPNISGIMLKSQLYEDARNLCRDIPDEIIASNQYQDATVDTGYKRDSISVFSGVYEDLKKLHNTLHGPSESFKNFELRFSTAIGMFN